MKLTDIKIGPRFRKAMGDLDALAASIRDRKGLFQPVVVTTDGQLVAGYRRLKACERLGWDDVPVRVVDPDDLVLAEHDENECREDFTPSERVAIAREVQRRIGDRQGQRTDTAATPPQLRGSPEEGGGSTSGQLPRSSSAPGDRPRDVAARAAGFASTDEYRRAATVVDRGVPELVDAMDAGEVTPSAAAEVAKLPKAEQKRVVKAGPEKVKEAAKEQREGRRQKRVVKAGPEKVKEAAEPAPDQAPPEAAPEDPAAAFVGRVNKLCHALDAAKKEAAELAAAPVYGRQIHGESVTAAIESARKALWQSRPTEPCNCVRGGTPPAPQCKACFGAGVCPASRVLKGGK